MNGNSWSKIVVLLDAKRLLITSWYLSLMFGSAFTAAHPSLLQPLNLLGLSTGGTSNIWRRHFLSYPPSLGGKGIRYNLRLTAPPLSESKVEALVRK